MTRLYLMIFCAFACAPLAEAREANHLAGAQSPYLLQHLNNPVDWYPWGQEALQKAKDENKPIFVSVGYSSCHWCHVMAHESFENAHIAALLNADFVSIKIDRETRPDLDEQFMFVTEALTGGGGWPNSVFLTPLGDPYFAGGYFPPSDFERVVLQVRTAWHDDPAFISAKAAKVTQSVANYMARKAEAREITPDALDTATDTILSRLDSFHGGYGVAPKFPRESMFLFLLDRAERTGDRLLLAAVTEALDGMIKGGIHDHIGGGFHRYAVDPEWHVPHFEKMLYNQAMIGRLLIRAWHATGTPRYRRAAERTFEYVLRDLRDPRGGFYSAQDADSLNPAGEKVEGAFYLWTEGDIAALGDTAGWISDVFHISPDGDLAGANVLHLSHPDILNRLDPVLDDMRTLRERRPKPFLDRKVVLSWNAMMIETLAEASYTLNRPDYYAAASQAAAFILNDMTPPDGLKRVWFDGAARIPAQLPDQTGLALAFVALHDYAPDDATASSWRTHAQALATDLDGRFGGAETGYRMAQSTDGLSHVIPVDDGDVPSGNALALTLLARLSQRMPTPKLEQDGFRLAAALSGHAISQPAERGFTLKAIQELQHGQTGTVRHAGKGHVRVELIYDRDSHEIAIDIQIGDGWHINAHSPLEDYFIATELSVTDQPNLDPVYPEPLIKSLAFNEAPLALYEGQIRLQAKLSEKAAGNTAGIATLMLQACSDELCLQPEKMQFALW